MPVQRRPRIGDRVRVRLQASCYEHGHLLWEDGATGVIVAVQRSPDRALPLTGEEASQLLARPGHEYRIRFEALSGQRATGRGGSRTLLDVEEDYAADELELLA